MTDDIDLHICRTVAFSALFTIACWLYSFPRTFRALSTGAKYAAACTAAAIGMTIVFLIIQERPSTFDLGRGENRTVFGSAFDVGRNDNIPQNETSLTSNYTTLFELDKPHEAVGQPTFSAYPPPDWTYRSLMIAFLDISFTFIGQVALPSFIAEMAEPK
jgi:hypothetical protein